MDNISKHRWRIMAVACRRENFNDPLQECIDMQTVGSPSHLN